MKTVFARNGWIMAALLALLLAGCGFHLRGSGGSYDLPFKTVYLVASAAPQFGPDLRQVLQAYGGATVVGDPKKAEVTVEVLTEQTDRTTLSINSQGRVRQYDLTYKVTFRVKDNSDGHGLIPPTSLGTVRTIDYNESQTLARNDEEQLLYRDMRRDLVQQVFGRLVKIKFKTNPEPEKSSS